MTEVTLLYSYIYALFCNCEQGLYQSVLKCLMLLSLDPLQVTWSEQHSDQTNLKISFLFVQQNEINLSWTVLEKRSQAGWIWCGRMPAASYWHFNAPEATRRQPDISPICPNLSAIQWTLLKIRSQYVPNLSTKLRLTNQPMDVERDRC